MNWFTPLFGIAIAFSSQCAFAKHRLTDPVKIARECKSEVELLQRSSSRRSAQAASKAKLTELPLPHSSQRNNVEHRNSVHCCGARIRVAPPAEQWCRC
jgi:hypothetical protein